MGFLLYDLTFLAVFSLAVVIFLYRKRKNLKREGILYLYRTKVGIKLINFIGGKYKKTLKVLSYFVILTGYILMIAMLYFLGKLIYLFFKFPEVVRAIKVPPLMPLIPYLPSIFKIKFLPPFYFTYWIIAVAIIAVSHEFSHGIFARFNNIKVKSTGFGFLGPFLAAFVEPDEKGMAKKPVFSQISVLSAGSFANVIMTIIFSLCIFLFFILTFTQAGATFNTYTYTIVNVSNINSVGDYTINKANAEKILDLTENKKIKNNLTIDFEGEKINLTAIIINNKTYFIDVESLKVQLETDELIVVYDGMPAIKAGLKGTIIEFNGTKIKNSEELTKEISEYKPGDNVEIKTKFDNAILSYNLKLAEHPKNKNKAFIGIGTLEAKKSGILGFVYQAINLFKKPGTAYEPKFDSGLIIFIYNLLWWIVIINISVALVNMLPVGIFDGGRVFYLTILTMAKKEKTAKRLFVVMTYIILISFLLLMLLWFLSIIQK